LRIYNDAVSNTTAIWNEQLSSLEQRIALLAERRQSGFPVLVAPKARIFWDIRRSAPSGHGTASATRSSIPSMSTRPHDDEASVMA
jgi:hypothetical protein